MRKHCVSVKGRLPLALSLFAGLFCASDLSAQVGAPAELSLREVWSADGETILDGLSIIMDLAETADGSIWILDTWPSQGRVLVLDPETMSARVVGETGEGPGEVDFPTNIAITPNGSVAVYDMRRRAVELYEANGDPARRVRLQSQGVTGFPRGFAVPASGGYLISRHSHTEPHAIHYFDDDGNWVRGWRERYPPRNVFSRNESRIAVDMAQQDGTGGSVYALSNGSFLYSQQTPHEVVRFDVSSTEEEIGWIEHPIVSMPELFESPGADIVQTFQEGGGPSYGYGPPWPKSLEVLMLQDGHILNVVSLPEKEGLLWQVFRMGVDGQGAVLVADTLLPPSILPNFVCGNGDVLAARRDIDTGLFEIVRLRLDFGESSP